MSLGPSTIGRMRRSRYSHKNGAHKSPRHRCASGVDAERGLADSEKALMTTGCLQKIQEYMTDSQPLNATPSSH
jgi:hypothetical protein